jgi:hypothetical protein
VNESREFQRALEALYNRAARREGTSKALAEIVPVFFKPGIEARVWCDDLGEVKLILDMIRETVGKLEAEGKYQSKIARIVSDEVDNKTGTIQVELSNGSAVILGFKRMRAIYLAAEGRR